MQEERDESIPRSPAAQSGEPSAADEQSAASESASEWAEIGRRIEQQLRRDAARLVGANDADDWSSIRDALVGRIRGPAESIDKTEIGRRAHEVGNQVEERVRAGIATATGAGTSADWESIGRTLRERIENLLDPPSPPQPGESESDAGKADAAVSPTSSLSEPFSGSTQTGSSSITTPSARPSPDEPADRQSMPHTQSTEGQPPRGDLP